MQQPPSKLVLTPSSSSPTLAAVVHVMLETQGQEIFGPYSALPYLRQTCKEIKAVIDPFLTGLYLTRSMFSFNFEDIQVPPTWIPVGMLPHITEVRASLSEDTTDECRDRLFKMDLPQLTTLRITDISIDNLKLLGSGNWPNLKELSISMELPDGPLEEKDVKCIVDALSGAIWSQKLQMFTLWGCHYYRRQSIDSESDNYVLASRKYLDMSYLARIVGCFPNLQSLQLFGCVDGNLAVKLVEMELRKLEILAIDEFYGWRNHAYYEVHSVDVFKTMQRGNWPKLQSLTLKDLEKPLPAACAATWLDNVEGLEISRRYDTKKCNTDLFCQFKGLKRLTVDKIYFNQFAKIVATAPLMALEELKLELELEYDFAKDRYQVDQLMNAIFTANFPVLSTLDLDAASEYFPPGIEWSSPPQSDSTIFPALKVLNISKKFRISKPCIDFLHETFRKTRKGCQITFDRKSYGHHDGDIRRLTEEERNLLYALYSKPKVFEQELMTRNKDLYEDIFVYQSISGEQADDLIKDQMFVMAFRHVEEKMAAARREFESKMKALQRLMGMKDNRLVKYELSNVASEAQLFEQSVAAAQRKLG